MRSRATAAMLRQVVLKALLEPNINLRPQKLAKTPLTKKKENIIICNDKHG